MKKTNAALVCIALLALMVLSWFNVIKNKVEGQSAFESNIQQAEKYVQKGIYIDAITCYQEALKVRPNDYDTAIQLARAYEQLGDKNGFLSACDTAAEISPKNPEPYVMKAEYYLNSAKYSDAIKAVKSIPNSLKNEESVVQLQNTLAHKYVIKYASYSDVADWHEQKSTNYVAVKEDGRWGMATKDGTQKIRLKYDDIGAYDENSGVIPCSEGGMYYYIDSKDNKKLVGDLEYDYLGSFGDGYAPAQRDGVYGYIDTAFHEEHFEFDYAGAFANKVAAVKKNEKWSLIDIKFKQITDYVYDEILVDSYGYCAMQNVIVARKGNAYVFLDTDGKQLSSRSFDGAAMPASRDGYIAVKLNGKWGFANLQGDMVIKEQFEEAKSFSLDLAPVKINGLWGYVDGKGELIGEPEYVDAGVFSSDGSAPVKRTQSWNFLVLCEYDN